MLKYVALIENCNGKMWHVFDQKIDTQTNLCERWMAKVECVSSIIINNYCIGSFVRYSSLTNLDPCAKSAHQWDNLLTATKNIWRHWFRGNRFGIVRLSLEIVIMYSSSISSIYYSFREFFHVTFCDCIVFLSSFFIFRDSIGKHTTHKLTIL